MISVKIKTPYELSQEIAKKSKDKRLSLNLSQQTLSVRSGVSYGTLKKFESSGQISLKSLLKIALVLDELENFEHLFAKNTEDLSSSLDELLRDASLREKSRKRGRK